MQIKNSQNHQESKSRFDLSFYNKRKVLVTGHTGFKGSWLCHTLVWLGAEVKGYSLKPLSAPNLYEDSCLDGQLNSEYGDIRNLSTFQKCLNDFKPEIVFHLAAQPLVRESYSNPVYTYETNVLGTVNVLEAIRLCASVRSVIIVTTDKVYRNNEWDWGYRETDQLDGFDPYSNSKSCAELVTNSYKRSFFNETKITISTVRAGNVIGGGDYSKDRILPDCIRAAQNNQAILVRNPYSIRPYQHVLEPIFAYLLLAQLQSLDPSLSGAYNIGPGEQDCVSTGFLVDTFCRLWGNDQKWEAESNQGPHEANFLKLDCSLIRNKTGWNPVWNIEEAIAKTIEWTKASKNNESIQDISAKQIIQYFNDQGLNKR